MPKSNTKENITFHLAEFVTLRFPSFFPRLDKLKDINFMESI